MGKERKSIKIGAVHLPFVGAELGFHDNFSS